MKENEYKCAICGEVNEKGWTDEEAKAESLEIWGEIPDGQQAVICDDCFNKRNASEINEMGNQYKAQKLLTHLTEKD